MEYGVVRQITRNIMGIKIPCVITDGKEWFPANFLISSIIGVKSASIVICRNYKDELKMLPVTYVENCTNDTWCFNRETIRKYLMNIQVGRLSEEQIEKLKELKKYFKVEHLDRYLEKNDVSSEYIDENFSTYEKDVINSIQFEKFKRCNKCKRLLPEHSSFYQVDFTSKNKDFYTVCNICYNGNWYKHSDEFKSKFYRKYGEDGYVEYFVNNDVYAIYKKRLNMDADLYLDIIFSEEVNIKKILNGLILENKITPPFNMAEIGSEFFKHVMQVRQFTHAINIDYLIMKFNGFELKNKSMTKEDVIICFKAYCNKNNIDIYDYMNIEFKKILTESGLFPKILSESGSSKNKIYGNSFGTGLTEFLIDLYGENFICYKLKDSNVCTFKYYTSVENRIRDFKYLIEQDLCIENMKIPMYLTTNTILQKNRTLYGVFKKFYKGSIYLLAEELYPGKYNQDDFGKGMVFNEFDSIEEQKVDLELRKIFNNVVYNSNHSDNTVRFSGSVPDWFIFLKDKIVVVEYFGVYTNNTKNKRVSDYVKRTDLKIEKYKNLSFYDFIFLYPDDLKKDFSGLKEKCKIYADSNIV